MYYYYLLFQLTNEIDLLIEKNTYNFIHIGLLSCVSRLLRHVVSRLLYSNNSIRDTPHTTFCCTKMHGLQGGPKK